MEFMPTLPLSICSFLVHSKNTHELVSRAGPKGRTFLACRKFISKRVMWTSYKMGNGAEVALGSNDLLSSGPEKLS